MMLYAGRDGQATCTAGKVKTLPSFVLLFLSLNNAWPWRELYYPVHIKTQFLYAESHQIMLEHLLHAAFDLLKSSQNHAFDIVKCVCVCVSKWAFMQHSRHIDKNNQFWRKNAVFLL